jgi:molybdate transport system substrate-binding protein
MSKLSIVSAGAAKGLVEALQGDWTATSGAAIEGTFGAVGAMKEKLLSGTACDVLILTQALLDGLAAQGVIAGDSIRPLGRVFTGIAVPDGAAAPPIDTPDALRDTLTRASAIYFPDPERATAGIHFAKVLRELGIADAVSSRLRTYPNGATAMRELAQAGDPAALGCTQVTEILYTRGVRLAGLLPKAFELSTLYCVAVCTASGQEALARDFVSLVAGPSTAPLREQGGFTRAT